MHAFVAKLRKDFATETDGAWHLPFWTPDWQAEDASAAATAAAEEACVHAVTVAKDAARVARVMVMGTVAMVKAFLPHAVIPDDPVDGATDALVGSHSDAVEEVGPTAEQRHEARMEEATKVVPGATFRAFELVVGGGPDGLVALVEALAIPREHWQGLRRFMGWTIEDVSAALAIGLEHWRDEEVEKRMVARLAPHGARALPSTHLLPDVARL